ncbi:hypothetical protein GQ600_19704 [Phytophthora cactorum]|nr:hypothetical protein GQ600_19704 [Phytophthora cactorum]
MPRRRGGRSETTKGPKSGRKVLIGIQSEGVVMQLLQQGLSERVIRAIIAVDGYRIGRLRTVLATEIDTLHTRRERLLPCCIH